MKFENLRIAPSIAIACACVLASILSVLLAGTVESALGGGFVPITTISRGEVIAALFVSPPFETLLLQGLPYVMFHERLSSVKCLLSMSVIFAFAHISKGYVVVLSSALGGMVLGSVFLITIRRSGKIAILATTLTHILHNFLTLLLSIAAGAVIV
jgi:membrane protease YdiL (CAAX protease family)